VLEALEADGHTLPNYVATLEPTSPLRSAALIDRCVELAVREDADSVITVVESHDVFGRFEEGGRFQILEDLQPWRRAARAPVYRNSSTVYITRVRVLRDQQSVVAGRLCAVVVTDEEGVDIDTLADFARAEALMRSREGMA
jgi:N-acylneuraminate cytidylyltransferase